MHSVVDLAGLFSMAIYLEVLGGNITDEFKIKKSRSC